MLTLSEHNRRMLYHVKLDWPVDAEIILDELKTLNWQYTSGFAHRARVEVHDEYSENLNQTANLKNMCDYVRRQQKTLLTYLYDNIEFKQHTWPCTSLEQLLNNTSTVCELYRDDPNWTMDVHIDHRAAVATGMLFFEPKDDKRKSTYFYTTEKRNNEQRMSCEYANGWYAANSHRSWHRGGNMGKDYRYSLLFASFLKLPT